MKQNTKILTLVFAGVLLIAPVFSQTAYGQATAWSYTSSLETTNGNGIMLRSVSHSGNTIYDRIELPYVWVFYGDGFTVRDDFPFPPCTVDCWGKTAHNLEKHTFTGGEYSHAIFYVGCQNWMANTEGCYKYEQQYWLYNDAPGSDPRPEMIMFLRAWGPGYVFTHGGGSPPTSYETYWRADTDVKGSALDTYERFTTSWTAVTTESAFTSIGSTDSGVEWRTYDTGTGNGVTKRIEIWPVLIDFDKIWLLRFAGTKSSPSELDGSPDGYDGTSSLTSQDDLYWMRTQRPGTDCVPAAPCSQAHVITLSGL